MRHWSKIYLYDHSPTLELSHKHCLLPLSLMLCNAVTPLHLIKWYWQPWYICKYAVQYMGMSTFKLQAASEWHTTSNRLSSQSSYKNSRKATSFLKKIPFHFSLFSSSFPHATLFFFHQTAILLHLTNLRNSVQFCSCRMRVNTTMKYLSIRIENVVSCLPHGTCIMSVKIIYQCKYILRALFIYWTSWQVVILLKNYIYDQKCEEAY